MFEPIRYISNSLSMSFPRNREIRRQANDLEDFFIKKYPDHYGQPQVIPVPDELDPEVPRLVFGSKHGFSQIVISQFSVTLNVSYSKDWQRDIGLGEKYLLERTSLLKDILGAMKIEEVFFCGLVTKARLQSKQDDEKILSVLRKFVHQPETTDRLHEISIKTSTILEEKFYSNVTIKNYREWKELSTAEGMPSFSDGTASERGVEIVGDFNDRYSYNELDGYRSPMTQAEFMINSGIKEIEKVAALFGEG